MTISKINPYIRVAMQSILRPHYEIKKRVLFDYELIYIEKGELTLVYADKSYLCTDGDILLLCPGVAHSFYVGENELYQPHIHFDLIYKLESENIPVSYKEKENMTEEELRWLRPSLLVQTPLQPFVSFSDKKSFLSLFYKIVSPDSRIDALTKKGLLTQLIAMLISDNFPDLFEKHKPYSVAQQIKDFIDAGQCFTMVLTDFERQFSYSRFYLEKKFKQEFGISLIEYRNIKRMEYAKQLLQENSVSRVAEELGYQSIYAFSRAYKLYYGVSPLNHKKM